VDVKICVQGWKKFTKIGIYPLRDFLFRIMSRCLTSSGQCSSSLSPSFSFSRTFPSFVTPSNLFPHLPLLAISKYKQIVMYSLE